MRTLSSNLQFSSGGLGHGYRGGHEGERLAANSALFHHVRSNCPLLPHSSFTFPSTRYTIMGRKDVSAEQLLERAIANGYEQEAHQAEDSIRDSRKYGKKTLKDQDLALRRYEK